MKTDAKLSTCSQYQCTTVGCRQKADWQHPCFFWRSVVTPIAAVVAIAVALDTAAALSVDDQATPLSYARALEAALGPDASLDDTEEVLKAYCEAVYGNWDDLSGWIELARYALSCTDVFQPQFFGGWLANESRLRIADRALSQAMARAPDNPEVRPVRECASIL